MSIGLACQTGEHMKSRAHAISCIVVTNIRSCSNTPENYAADTFWNEMAVLLDTWPLSPSQATMTSLHLHIMEIRTGDSNTETVPVGKQLWLKGKGQLEQRTQQPLCWSNSKLSNKGFIYTEWILHKFSKFCFNKPSVLWWETFPFTLPRISELTRNCLAYSIGSINMYLLLTDIQE